MTLRYLLDTNVISEPLKVVPDEHVLLRLKQHQESIAISSVVWHELCYGCARLPTSIRRTTIDRYLQQVVAPTIPILPYDTRAAAWHAHERARLSALGLTPPFADGQIAAVAMVHQLILVTFNTSDYTHFAGLAVEDWRTHSIPG
jgi:tRNA(fMet)-specific endonuclease VapC